MVIAVGIAMSLDWARPSWAALGVAVCTQLSDGESIQKAFARIGGTLLGAIVLLIGMSAFPQDRFLVLLYAGSMLFTFGYLMSSVRNFYFFYIAAVLPVLIATADQSDPILFFQLVTTRLLDTCLGVGVYVAVALMLFPTSTAAKFRHLIQDQAGALRKLIGAVVRGADKETAQVLSGLHQRQAAALGSLDVAGLDSLDIHERRADWRRAVALLGEALDAVDWAMLERAALPRDVLARELPGLERYDAEMAARLEAIAAMVDRQPAEAKARDVDLAFSSGIEDRLEAEALGTLLSLRAHLLEIDRQTRALLDTVERIVGRAEAARPAAPLPAPSRTIIPDPERVMCAVRVVIGFWAAHAFYIYVWGMPMPPFVLLVATVAGLQLSMMMPFIRPIVVMPAVIVGMCGGFVIHIFLMPQLSGFTELALFMIFPSVFLILYFFSGINKAIGIALWAAATQLNSNVQVYSFSFFTDGLAAVFIAVCLLQLVWQFPFNFTPQRGYERQLRRYLQSADAMLQRMQDGDGHGETWWQRQLRIHHQKQVAVLPQRLSVWASQLPVETVGPEVVQHAKELSTRLGVLSKRLDELSTGQRAGAATPKMAGELAAWRATLAALSAGIEGREKAWEEGAQATSDHPAAHEIRPETASPTGDGDAERQALSERYRRLSASRAMSSALAGAMEQAREVDWPRLREPRFNV